MRLAPLIAITLSLTGLTPLVACSRESVSPQRAADILEAKLRNVSAVNFYALSRTEEYDYPPAQFIRESTVRVYRACGGNCHNVMRPVIDQLRRARSTPCTAGQQRALIRASPDIQVVYGFNQIRISGHCYQTNESIRRIIGGTGILF